ncbi:hypothetical protein UNDKW_4296 [Undibacterium sp. KW1]|nr:hypothetical protein UNDKW_4296 [Undibacterium sp. KW1]
MFQGRKWPEGFEFPSCAECNHGSTNDDLLIAVLARIGQNDGQGDQDGALSGLVKSANRQYPNLIQNMKPTALEERNLNKRLGINPVSGQAHQDIAAMKLPDVFHKAVAVLASKLVKGVYYQYVGKAFPLDGCLLMNWFTNAQIFLHGNYIVSDIFKSIDGEVPPIVRSGKYLDDQFEIKLSISSDKNSFMLQVLFGKSFGFVVIGCVEAGRLETRLNDLRDQAKRDGPFVILQSQCETKS